MVRGSINFSMISKALSVSMEALQSEQQPSVPALQKLKKAEEELRQALSFSLASRF